MSSWFCAPTAPTVAAEAEDIIMTMESDKIECGADGVDSACEDVDMSEMAE